MNHLRSLLCLCIAAALAGCGPMQIPMPVRLDDEQQKKINESWDKALTPVGRLDHPSLLDVMLSTQAYHFGVDKLTFRSEKRVTAGTVVMEIEYDRRLPGQDRFEVKLYDVPGQLVRQEIYGRQEINDAYAELFVRYAQLQQAVDAGNATPADVNDLARIQARRDAVAAIFPEMKEDRPKEAEGKH
jgi:hypothetical protein